MSELSIFGKFPSHNAVNVPFLINPFIDHDTVTSSLGYQSTNVTSPSLIMDTDVHEDSQLIESMRKAARPYSPDQKRERIERYRNKRNLRNYNKRIKYECRKKLAQRRARVRGRFVKKLQQNQNPWQWQWDTSISLWNQITSNTL